MHRANIRGQKQCSQNILGKILHFWPRCSSTEVTIGEMILPLLSAVGADVQCSSSEAAMPRGYSSSSLPPLLLISSPTRRSKSWIREEFWPYLAAGALFAGSAGRRIGVGLKICDGTAIGADCFTFCCYSPENERWRDPYILVWWRFLAD